MFKPLALFIGLRYTRAKRRNNFISFISAMSMAGMVLGVAVLIIVMSVMNGFDQQLQTRILGMVPQATVSGVNGSIKNWKHVMKQLQQSKGVVAAAPFSESQGLATTNGVVQGIMLNGITPSLETHVSIIGNHMHQGSLFSLQPGKFNVVIGDLLAQKLGVSLGEKITIILPSASVNPMGVFPRMKRFNVSGIFSIGANLDETQAYINIRDAAAFLRLPAGSVQGIRLKVSNLFDAEPIAWSAASKLPESYYVNTWTHSYGQLFSAIHMEKMMVGLLLFFLVGIAAFNIISTLMMVVNDKRGDIAILRTFGASPSMIMVTFMVQGTFIGIVGSFIGAVLGILGALNISTIVAWIQQMLGIQILSPHVYFISYLPSDLHWQDVAVICGISFILSFLATLYPAWRAAKTQPAEALRYE